MTIKDKKISKLISLGFLISSILLLIYTYYRSEISHQGHHNSHYVKYYILSTSGILFWSLVITLKEHVRIKILLVFSSILIGVYMIEIGISFLTKPTITKAESAKIEGKPFDSRSRSEFIRSLGEKGIEAVPNFAPSKFARINYQLGKKSICPLGGISKTSTVGNNESGEYMTIKSDRYGFNNDDNIWDAKKISWMLVGDSFAFGQAVERGQDISSRINTLTNESSLTLGNNGNGPLAELGTIIEYGSTYKPTKLIWLYYEGNDLIEDLKIEKEIPTFMNYLDSKFSQNLINRQSEIDHELKRFIEEKRSQLSIGKKQSNRKFLQRTEFIRLGNIRRLFQRKFEAHKVEIDPIFSKILSRAKEQTKSWEGKFYFVYLPDFFRYSSKGVNHETLFKRREVIELVESLNIPVIDIHELVFAKELEPLSLFPWKKTYAHYNPLGYEKIAKSIIKSVGRIN